jgi:hypothetical protein
VGECLGIDQEPAIVPIVAGPAPLPEVWRQAACKPGSVPGRSRGTAIPLGCPSPDTSRDLPGRPARERACTAPCGRAVVPTWSCSRWGLPCLSRCRPSGALLPPRFTLARRPPTRRLETQAGGMLSAALSLRSPSPGVTRHRVPVEPGLSSPAYAAGAAIRPPAPGFYLILVLPARKPATSSTRPMVASSSTPSQQAGRQRRWKARHSMAGGTPCAAPG